MRCYDTCCAPEYDSVTEIVSVKAHRARKARKCGLCGRPLGVGKLYERVAIIYDGTFTTFPRCLNASCDWLGY